MGNQLRQECMCQNVSNSNQLIINQEYLPYSSLIQDGIIDPKNIEQIIVVKSMNGGHLVFSQQLNGKCCIFVDEKKILFCGKVINGVGNDKSAVIVFKDKSWYQGQVYNGKIEGSGKWQNPSLKISYVGDFKNGNQNGKGVQRAPGANYSGQFINGIKEGYGILQFDDKSVYIGEFKNNQIDGEGIYHSAKSKTIGHWDRGVLNGKAKQYYKDGSYYEGVFKNGQKSGVGFYYWPDGTQYEGQFKKDFISGEGVLKNLTAKFKGQWNEDKSISLQRSKSQFSQISNITKKIKDL